MQDGGAGTGRRVLPVAAPPRAYSGEQVGQWRLEIHDEVPSTADLVRARAEAGAPAGLAVLARRQTMGRGSRGRAWVAPEGNLNLSILLRPAVPPRRAGRFALLAGVALSEVLDHFLPVAARPTLRLKWPNDVLLGGRKLAGILIDAALAGADRLDFLAIGIGANLAAAPELADRPTACLAELIPAPLPEEVARQLLHHLDTWLGREAADEAAMPTAWLARAHAQGEHLRIALGEETVEGAFAGISPEGNLLLRTATGLRDLATGEILLGGS